MNIPQKITAGDSISWNDDATVNNLGAPITSALWVLKYSLRQNNVAPLTVTAVASGSGWITTLSKTQTAQYASGPLYFQAYAEYGTDRFTLGSGSVEVLVNLSSVAVMELRSQAVQDLEAVQSAMRAMISNGAVAEYSIGGRSLRKLALSDLIMLESKLKYAVAKEKKAESIANGLGNPNNVFVRFK